MAALVSGEYSPAPATESANPAPVASGGGIAPGILRRLLGKGHPEFSTPRQQVLRSGINVCL